MEFWRTKKQPNAADLERVPYALDIYFGTIQYEMSKIHIDWTQVDDLLTRIPDLKIPTCHHYLINYYYTTIVQGFEAEKLQVARKAFVAFHNLIETYIKNVFNHPFVSVLIRSRQSFIIFGIESRHLVSAIDQKRRSIELQLFNESAIKKPKKKTKKPKVDIDALVDECRKEIIGNNQDFWTTMPVNIKVSLDAVYSPNLLALDMELYPQCKKYFAMCNNIIES